MDAEQTPEYRVQLRTSSRLVPRQYEPKVGIAWEITRFIGQQEGEWPKSETLFVSSDVFDDEDGAKHDAVRTLKSLLCCDESPLRIAFRTAIDWMVDEGLKKTVRFEHVHRVPAGTFAIFSGYNRPCLRGAQRR